MTMPKTIEVLEIHEPFQNIPARTAPVELTRSANRLFMIADSDNSGTQSLVIDVPGQQDSATPSVLSEYWDGQPAWDYTLTLLQYYKKVCAGVLEPGADFNREVAKTHGISSTESMTLSASLGIEAKGLSAKVEATFGRAVTVNDESTVTEKFLVKSPKKGKRVFVIWQRVYEIAALGHDGNPISSATGRKANIAWNWADSDGDFSGAYVNYANVWQTIPSEETYQQIVDFPDA
jgi:hypothetical protein